MVKLRNASLGMKAVAIAGVLVASGAATGAGLAAASSSPGSSGSNGAPPAPVIGSNGLPTDPTSATTANFTYSDARPAVTFLCSLDSATFTACPVSGISYQNLTDMRHTFKVEAQSGNGPVSQAAAYSWSVGHNPFPISGSLSTPLAPGVAAQPLNLTVKNPYSFNMKVTALSVSVLSTTGGSSCLPSPNFKTTAYSGSGFTVPAGVTETLSKAVVPSTQWPTIQMVDLSTNQDGCQRVSLNLSYGGSATTP